MLKYILLFKHRIFVDYDIVVIEQVLKAPIKNSKKEEWITLKAPLKPLYKERDYDLFSFLAGTEGRIKAFKPHNKWENVSSDLKIKHIKQTKHTTYSLKELIRAEKLYKSYINAGLNQIPNELIKQVRFNDFFSIFTLRGEFYLTEGYLDYRILLCFTR